jgi:hypothetical protein
VRPYPEEIILALQRGVSAHFLPELKSAYAQAQFMPAQLLFGIALRDANTAAQDLVENNLALRSLLADVADGLTGIDRDDARAAATALAALPPTAPDIRLTSLRTEFDALRQAFCDIAPLLEPAADDPALAPLRSVRDSAYLWFSTDARKRAIPILNN